MNWKERISINPEISMVNLVLKEHELWFRLF